MAEGFAPAEESATLRDRLRERGLRWTPQRRMLLEVLEETDGHVTGAELVERCRARDAATTPSTVYRTLDLLEELGIVRHAHGVNGGEEFHVRPAVEHGHLHCTGCGETWELDEAAARPIVAAVAGSHDFEVDLSHVTIAGRCAHCRRAGDAGSLGDGER